MFKREKIDESILVEMEKNLYKNAFVEDTRQQNDKVKAIGLLVTAAENFEKSGLLKEAEAVTRIIESVANDPATSGLTPEKEVKNLETTGIPLNLTDAAKADDPFSTNVDEFDWFTNHSQTQGLQRGKKINQLKKDIWPALQDAIDTIALDSEVPTEELAHTVKSYINSGTKNEYDSEEEFKKEYLALKNIGEHPGEFVATVFGRMLQALEEEKPKPMIDVEDEKDEPYYPEIDDLANMW